MKKNSKKSLPIKKPTEFAVNSFLYNMQVVQLNELDLVTEKKTFDENDSCHIYLICTRPRISLNKEKSHVSPEFIDLRFKIWKEDEFSDYKISLKNDFEDKNVIIESVYPYNYFNLKSPSLNYKAKSAALIQKITHGKANHPDFLDLNVLYVGQSYGIEGARTAPDRLKSHSTLQTIYSDLTSKSPDKEVWFFLMSFRQMGIMRFDGISQYSAKEWEDDATRTASFMKKMYYGGITEQQFINFTEAALIRYFQPEYNIKFKKTFPNPAHSTYSECYDLDVNTVNVELGTLEANNINLFSDHIKPQPRHFAQFILHNKEERIGMFDF